MPTESRPTGELVEIACDESGSEGEKLIGGETDVFAHASVQLSTESAADCIQETRDRIRSPALEYKSGHLLRTKHRSVLKWLLGPSGPIHGNAHVFLTDKTFFVAGKVAELVAEVTDRQVKPEAAALHREGQRVLGRDRWEAFLESFNDLMRVTNRRGAGTSVDSFLRMVDTLRLASISGEVHDIMDVLWQARSRIEDFRARLLDNPRMIPAMDPLIPAIVETVGHWSAGGRRVSIVHDEQPSLTEERIAQLKEILGTSSRGRLVSLRFVDSRSDPRVQVADFLAGVARKIASDELNGRGDAELTALLRPYVDSLSSWGDDRSWSRLEPTSQELPVSVSWEHAYGACEPAAAELLRAVSALDLAVVSSPAVGVAAELTPDETATSLTELTRTGWVRAIEGDGHHAVVEQARGWLARNAAGLVEAARGSGIIRRFTDFHAAAVDLDRHDPAEAGAWLAEHRAEVLAAVRACDREGLRRHGTRLASAVWPSAGLVRDPPWWHELAGAGAALAIADRDPEMLADLLHRSAATYAGHGDRLRAEAHWVRALAIIRRDLSGADQSRDRDRGVAVLTGLGALYRGWGRLSKALDADLGIVDLQRAAGDALGTAAALTRVAATMRAAGRLSSATDYLAQADEAMTPITEAADCAPQLLTAHARILVWWGRALWEQGHHGAARRPWSRALAMVIDVDDEAADHVRALLATAPEEPLPGGFPNAASDDGSALFHDEGGVSNTSSSSSGGKG